MKSRGLRNDQLHHGSFEPEKPTINPLWTWRTTLPTGGYNAAKGIKEIRLIVDTDVSKWAIGRIRLGSFLLHCVEDVFQCQATQNVTKNSNFYVCPTWRTFLRTFYYVETLRRTILFTPHEQKNRVAFRRLFSPWRFWSQIRNNQTIFELDGII